MVMVVNGVVVNYSIYDDSGSNILKVLIKTRKSVKETSIPKVAFGRKVDVDKEIRKKIMEVILSER